MLEELKNILGIEDSEKLKQVEVIINNEKSKYNKTIENLKAQVEDKDAKYKELEGNLNSVKSILGVDENTPLNEDLLKVKLSDNKNADIEKIESKYNEIIENLNKKYAEEKVQLETKLKEVEQTKKDLIIETKLKSIPINAQEGALDDVVRYLKEGVDINDVGELVYKQDDIVLRNDKGYPLTVADKLKELQGTKKYLFKSDVQQGENPINPKNIKTPVGSDFGEKMRQRALSLGIGVQ